MCKKKLLIVSACLALISCGKYESGPKFSLKTKKARISNTWKIEEFIIHIPYNGTSYGAQFDETARFYFDKNGIYKYTGINNLNCNGVWKLINNSENILINTDCDIDTLTILKLKSKEFWYILPNQISQDTIIVGNDTILALYNYEYHLIEVNE